MNNLDTRYQALLQDILDNGVTKKDRTGTGTISVFGRQIRHKMSEGFPLLTTKKMPFKTIVTELLWFLKGDTNIKYLVDNNCHIWDGDAYKNYVKHWEPNIEYIDNKPILTQEEFINKIKTDDEFARKWGSLGKIYGYQWRNWGERKHDSISNEYFIGIDQIANLIHDLKTNPDSRRLMVNAWNVGELDEMVLPPCHYGFQVYTRELTKEEKLEYVRKYVTPVSNDSELVLISSTIPTRAISLMWNQRSVDTFLGLPFNIASYGLLLEIIAKEVNMIPDELIGNLGDVHLYNNHIEQAKEQIGRLTLEERRVMVTQEQFDKIYTAGRPDSLSHSEIDQFDVPRRTREPFELPKLGMDYREGEYDKNLKDFVPDDFYLIDYQSHPTIKAPLSN
jgi:thymidylate synthase